ncbi:MAG: hypothetical protein A2X94_09310 [Bdellovibrionales bacterium GWB1_55_8]|nr:MAG: hypothetical protein A2X94_09310 [Bdellovibrionales bacterium GWB1_55_8]
METNALFAKINKLPEGWVLERVRFGRSQTASIWIEGGKVIEIGRFLKDDPNFDFDWLENVSVAQLDRVFAISYFLRSRNSGHTLVLRCSVDVPPNKQDRVEFFSVQEVWEAAAPFESEISDLFGIVFSSNEKSMMSALTGEKGFGGFPLRKDYTAGVPLGEDG